MPEEVRAEDDRRLWVEVFAAIQPYGVRVEPVQYGELTAAGWQFTHNHGDSGGGLRSRRRASLDGGFLLADYSNGLMPRRVSWWWAAGAGVGGGGVPVAFNLVSGFNDRGGGESTLWLGGVPHAIGALDFGVEERDWLRPWTIRSSCGAIDLVFRPEGMRSETLDLGPVRSRYRQPFGVFAGKACAAGATVPVDGALGVAERHEALW